MQHSKTAHTMSSRPNHHILSNCFCSLKRKRIVSQQTVPNWQAFCKSNVPNPLPHFPNWEYSSSETYHHGLRAFPGRKNLTQGRNIKHYRGPITPAYFKKYISQSSQSPRTQICCSFRKPSALVTMLIIVVLLSPWTHEPLIPWLNPHLPSFCPLRESVF